MQSDAYTRVMLSLIAVLLALIAAQHFAGEPGKNVEPERYELLNVRLGRALTALRIDQATGNVWRLRAEEGDLSWEPIPEDGEPSPAEGAEAETGEGGGGATDAGAEGVGEPAAEPAPAPAPPQQGP